MYIHSMKTRKGDTMSTTIHRGNFSTETAAAIARLEKALSDGAPSPNAQRIWEDQLAELRGATGDVVEPIIPNTLATMAAPRGRGDCPVCGGPLSDYSAGSCGECREVA